MGWKHGSFTHSEFNQPDVHAMRRSRFGIRLGSARPGSKPAEIGDDHTSTASEAPASVFP